MYYRHDIVAQVSPPLIPIVPQPNGFGFFIKTWTGRIILINLLMFVLTCWMSRSGHLFNSDLSTLIALGAKDNVLIAKGQYWRLITPMFIHSGLIHFAFNNWALFVISYQIEYQLGSRNFVLLYLGSGLTGSLASLVKSATVSVGASGALFGLLGFGFYIERMLQSKIEAATGVRPRAGAYTGMVIANIAFGLMIPQIDNAAHFGGLIFGFAFAYIWVRIVPNRLMPSRPTQAKVAACVLIGTLTLGAILGSSHRYVLYQLERAIEGSSHVEELYYNLNRMIELEPRIARYRLSRLKIALQIKDYGTARGDFFYLQNEGDFENALNELLQQLQAEGFLEGASWLKNSLANVSLSR